MRPGAKLGTTGWGAAPGVLELPLGTGILVPGGVTPRGGQRVHPGFKERGEVWARARSRLPLAGAVHSQQGLPGRSWLRPWPLRPGAGTWQPLSRTVNTLCATFFSGTLGAGRVGGEREAGVRTETFLYTTNFLYIFNFAAT